MDHKVADGLTKFQVQAGCVKTKTFEVFALDVQRAQNIGQSLAEKHDWADFDTISYSAVAELSDT